MQLAQRDFNLLYLSSVQFRVRLQTLVKHDGNAVQKLMKKWECDNTKR